LSDAAAGTEAFEARIRSHIDVVARDGWGKHLTASVRVVLPR
jgi:hypothetical protein